MHLNVSDLLVKELGYSHDYQIMDEHPPMLSLTLTKPVNGVVTVTKLEGDSLDVKGRVSTQLELECHRCLRSYTSATEIRFHQVFASRPADDELPISGDLIDLAPLIEQELIVSLPIKLLCQPDCPGVPGAEHYQNHSKGTL
jgi:uncharacterized protein